MAEEIDFEQRDAVRYSGWPFQRSDLMPFYKRSRAATLAGFSCWVQARCFVLAARGLENARFLLSSNGASPAGIGNEHHLVGRFLMDHQAFRLGVIQPSSRELFTSLALCDLRRVRPWMAGDRSRSMRPSFEMKGSSTCGQSLRQVRRIRAKKSLTRIASP